MNTLLDILLVLAIIICGIIVLSFTVKIIHIIVLLILDLKEQIDDIKLYKEIKRKSNKNK